MASNDPLPSPSQLEPEPSRGPWLGLGIGLALIFAVVALLIFSSRSSPTRGTTAPKVMDSATSDPYADKLKLSDIVLSAAQNFAGGTSTYVEGKITNSGDRVVTGATVEIAFKNSLNQVVQRETQPLMVVQSRQPAIDVAALNVAPLRPGATREFRLTFERISADWSQQLPDLRVVTVSLK